MQYGGHAVRESDALAFYQTKQSGGFIATGIDLLDAHQRGRVRQTPGVNMKHRRDRHVNVAAVKTVVVVSRTQSRGQCQRMQDQLAMAVKYTLGFTGGAGGIKSGCRRIFVELIKLEFTARGSSIDS